MFNALKEKASKGAQAAFEQELKSRLGEKLEMFKALKPADVQDDAKYAALIVRPLWSYVKLQSGGALTAVQKVMDVNIEERFGLGLFHVRNELIRVEEGAVKLVPDFTERLAPTIMQAVTDPKK
jgi:hypothetical protein